MVATFVGSAFLHRPSHATSQAAGPSIWSESVDSIRVMRPSLVLTDNIDPMNLQISTLEAAKILPKQRGGNHSSQDAVLALLLYMREEKDLVFENGMPAMTWPPRSALLCLFCEYRLEHQRYLQCPTKTSCPCSQASFKVKRHVAASLVEPTMSSSQITIPPPPPHPHPAPFLSPFQFPPFSLPLRLISDILHWHDSFHRIESMQISATMDYEETAWMDQRLRWTNPYVKDPGSSASICFLSKYS